MTAREDLQSILLEAQYACFNRQRSLRFPDAGTASVQQHDDCILVKDPMTPLDTYVNRIIVPAPIKAARLIEIVKAYEDEGLVHAIDLLPHAIDSDLSSQLVRSGFIPIRELIFLHSKPEPDPPSPAALIKVRRMGSGEGREFLEAVKASIGQEIDPSIMASKSPYYEQHPFVCYLATVGDELAGLATLYLDDDRAWMANAFTFPAFRGRGVQSALIQRRIQDAALFGVKSLFTDVEFLSPSYRNLQRMGFAFHYASTSWERSTLPS